MIHNQSMDQFSNNMPPINQNMVNEIYQNMLNLNLDPNMINMNLNQMIQNMMLININQNQMKINTENDAYYEIIHKNPLIENNLNRNKKNLSLFFNGITVFKKKFQNMVLKY